MLATERYDSSDPINLGSGFEISIRELTETIAAVVGFEGQILWDPSKPNGQPRRKIDTRRAEERFDFRSTTPFAAALRQTVDWFLAARVTQ